MSKFLDEPESDEDEDALNASKIVSEEEIRRGLESVDSLKAEGNFLFSKGDYLAALDVYTVSMEYGAGF